MSSLPATQRLVGLVLLAALSHACSSDGNTAANSTDDATDSLGDEGSGDDGGDTNGSGDDTEVDDGDDTSAVDTTPPGPLTFGPHGSLVAPSGRGGFSFGVATAATQIEDSNPAVDWFTWTAPAPDGLGNGTFVGDAVQGYTRAIPDLDLVTAMNLDTYRFSIEWARVEPRRDEIDTAALAHYGEVLDAMRTRGITPNITVHHFSNPTWVHDPRDKDCREGSGDTNLCGWSVEGDASQLIGEIAEHAALLASTYGDRVDNWATFNEPFNYILAGYGFGSFPPGQNLLLSDFDRLVATYRNLLDAHAAIYDAIKQNDTIDADGDGVAAAVGLTLNVISWQPARANRPSEDPADIAAAERMDYAYNRFVPGSILAGTFDVDLDGVVDEQHPDWAGKLDWLGVQYYFRGGVTAKSQAIRQLGLTPCYPPIDFGSCIPPEDSTKWIPEMRYEYWEPGIYEILKDFGTRWPNLPMIVSESGLATEVGRRRSEHVVRSLEQVHRAIDEGVDVRGYYHWSLTDNFEWAEGFGPRFGLYTVDYSTYERSPTEGAITLGEIAGSRSITTEQRERLGGLGPMTEETAR